MRTLKFRVWNGEQMISPDYIDRDGFAHWKENSIPEMSNKIMQFTGLKDKNGKEIYEGDILRYRNRQLESISFVVWALDGWRFNSYMCAGTLDLYPYVDTTRNHDHGIAKIIGNIHENPELLKK